MRVLIETRMNSLRLTESKAPKKGCLGRLEGICADFKNPTRNGRLYPIGLWKKVFEDNLFKESLENKTLFGELDHPEDRFEPLISEACVVMTDYRIDENKGVIYGGFDILDTPKGRILKSIVDYGSVVGVSSRGQGDIVESMDGGEMVDEDTYEFACFDVVSTPAVEKARQTVAESIRRIKTETFTESVSREIEEAETVADLNIIRSVIRTSNLNESEMESLIESIEDKCKSLQNVGETITAESKDSKQSLIESASKASDSANTIRDKKKLYRCISALREQVSAYQHREKRYLDTIHEKESDIESLQDDIRRLDGQSKRSKKKYESITSGLDRKLVESNNHANRATSKANMLEQRVSRMQDDNSKLNEAVLRERKLKEQTESSNRKLQETIMREKKLSERLKSENEQLQAELTAVKQSAMKSKRDVDRLTETVKSNTSTEHSLHEKITQQKSRIRKLEEDVQRLSEDAEDRENEIMRMDSELEKYNTLLEQAQSKLSDSTGTISQLQESVDSISAQLRESNAKGQKLLTELKKYQDSYIRKVSHANGLNPNDVKKSVKGIASSADIDSLVESLRDTIDRNNNIGISDEGIKTGDGFIIESISGRPKSDDASEEQRLTSFLDMVSGSNY